MEIETKHASLDTLAVTIKTLHVNGKQMTLAVFRQLPIKNEDKNSELWGIVRYSIKDSGDIWLVFSDNGVLYRRALDLNKPTFYDLNKHQKLIESKKRYLAKMQLSPQFIGHLIKQAQKEVDILLKKEIELQIEYEYLLDEYKEEYQLSLMIQLFIAV